MELSSLILLMFFYSIKELTTCQFFNSTLSEREELY